MYGNVPPDRILGDKDLTSEILDGVDIEDFISTHVALLNVMQEVGIRVIFNNPQLAMQIVDHTANIVKMVPESFPVGDNKDISDFTEVLDANLNTLEGKERVGRDFYEWFMGFVEDSANGNIARTEIILSQVYNRSIYQVLNILKANKLTIDEDRLDKWIDELNPIKSFLDGEITFREAFDRESEGPYIYLKAFHYSLFMTYFAEKYLRRE